MRSLPTAALAFCLFGFLMAACTSSRAAVPVPAPGEWVEVPLTGHQLVDALPTSTELGAPWSAEIRVQGAPGLLSEWTGMTYITERELLCLVRAGGHADYLGADSYCLDLTRLDDAGVGWFRAEPVQHLTGPVDNNGRCHLPSYGGPAEHTYDDVPYLGGSDLLFTGSPGGCLGFVMSPANMLWRVTIPPVVTDQWTWTLMPDALRTYVPGSSATFGDWLVLTTGTPKSAILDKNTFAVVRSMTRWWGTVKAGVEQPYATGFTANMGAMGINDAGVVVLNGGTALNVGQVNGTRTPWDPVTQTGCRTATNNAGPTCNDNSFGRWVKRAVGTAVTDLSTPFNLCMSQIAGYNSMIPLPGGSFAILDGGKRVIIYTVGAGNTPSLDTCVVYDPATGPTDGTGGRFYEKAFWNDNLKLLMSYPNRNQGLWFFNVPGLGPVEPPTPPVTGDYGPPPNASLANLCQEPGTILCDPLDTTPITGPYIKPTTINLTLPDGVGRYGDWRWPWRKTGNVTPTVNHDVKVEGDGSLMFTIPSQSNASAPSLYTVDVDPDHVMTNGVRVGETMRVRLKVMWSCDVLFTDCNPASPTYKQERRHYQMLTGSGGIKIFSIGEGDRGFLPADYMDSAEGLGGVVTGNGGQKGYYDGYVQVWYLGIQKAGAIINGIRQWDNQPGGPLPCWKNDPVTGLGMANAWRECTMINADEWVTLQGELSFGPCTNNSKDPALASNWKLYVANEGEPFVKVIDSPINVRCGSGVVVPGLMNSFGKIWLTPYNTGKDPSEVTPVGKIYYDNLWVERIGGAS